MKNIFLAIFLIIFISAPLVSLAEGLVPCGNPGEEACTLCDFFVMIDNIIDFLLLRIVPVLAALMIAIGGFIYIFSRGNPEMLAWSERLFTSVAYGLIIIYGAWLFVNLFFQIIGVEVWTGLKEGWWTISCH